MIRLLLLAVVPMLSSCVSSWPDNVTTISMVTPGTNIRLQMKNGEKIRNFKVVGVDPETIVGIYKQNNSELRLLRLDEIKKIEIVQWGRKETKILTTVGLVALVVVVTAIVLLNNLASALSGTTFI